MSWMSFCLAVLCVSAAVLVWPSPDPARRLPMLLSTSRSGIMGTVAAAWWVVPAVVGAVWFGAHVALAAVMVLRTWQSTMRRAERRKAEIAGGSGTARLMEALAGELTSGAAPIEALETASREVPEDFAAPVAALVTRIRLGSSAVTGPGASTGSSSSVARALHGVSSAWQLSEAHGVPLSDLAAGMRADAVGRHAHRSSVNASLAGPRATMMILAALPLLGIGMGQALGAAPLGFLFGGGLGGWVLVAGTVAACTGILWSQQILAKAEGTS